MKCVFITLKTLQILQDCGQNVFRKTPGYLLEIISAV